MAKGELVTPARGSLATQGGGRDTGSPGGGHDVWQGYGVRWTDTGLEITAPTSRESYGPLLVGGAAGVIAAVLLAINVPDVSRGQSMADPGLWLVAAAVGFIVMCAVASPFYLLPRSWLRSRGDRDPRNPARAAKRWRLQNQL